MTNTDNLGAINTTTAEWTTRLHYADGTTKTGTVADEEDARFAYEAMASLPLPHAVSTGSVVVGVELVSRTRAEFADGAILLSAWQVTE